MQRVDVLEPDESQVELDGTLALLPLTLCHLKLLGRRIVLGSVEPERGDVDEELDALGSLGELVGRSHEEEGAQTGRLVEGDREEELLSRCRPTTSEGQSVDQSTETTLIKEEEHLICVRLEEAFPVESCLEGVTMALVQRLDVPVVDNWPQARLFARSERVSISPYPRTRGDGRTYESLRGHF